MTDNKRPWSPPQIIWSALLGMLVWSAVGFSWFGHGFDWTTQGGAEQMRSHAVVESLAAICVAQAHAAPNAAVALKEFAGLSEWKQDEFIDKARWAVMPGSDAPRDGVTGLCAEKLRKT